MRYKDINIRNLFSHTFVWQLLLCAVLLFAPCSMFNAAHAQPKIYGNVYGGGREGDTGGNTTVTVCAVDLDGDVFGGARQANVGGRAFVHINGEKMSDDILINHIFGGNDVAGTIGASIDKKSSTIPDELTEAVANGITDDETGDGGGKNKKNKNGYSAFVLTTKERTTVTSTGENPVTTQPYNIFIGQLFGGGNGDYTYTKDGNDFIVKRVSDNVEVARSSQDFVKPDLAKTYIEMRGGSCAILYGGGNAVTVTEATDICIDNESTVTTEIKDKEDESKNILEDSERLKRMGIYKMDGQGYVNNPDYQFSRVFGGNNKATMAIRPTWHLKKGLIRNLYSGGNKGDMTYYDSKTKYGGIFLYINSDGMEIGNVYGGCRMSDVNPGGMSHVKPSEYVVAEENIKGTKCPEGYAARVIITGGKIKNVYGGNDISGTVYGGSAVGIHCSIEGNVYGGGNGSYAYTDNSDLANDKNSDGAYLYGDYYYDASGSTSSVEALNKFRPKTEKVTIRLISDDTQTPKRTIIGGSVYCGGNSASLGLDTNSENASAELKIGSYVYADNVYLGNNGANMVTPEMLEKLASNNVLGYDFSKIDLTDDEQMAKYMKGCELSIRPTVVFDKKTDSYDVDHTGYIAYSTYFGSLYCGGNVGSVNVPGMSTLDFDQEFVIFNKLVGGCNSAYIPASTYNAAFDGGLIADPDSTTQNKLTLNLANIKIQPMRWKNENDKSQLLEWNTFIGDEKSNVSEDDYKGEASDDDLNRRFKGGNIYGGCYTSGHINGNVVININGTIIERGKKDMEPGEVDYGIFDGVDEDEQGEAILYGHDSYTIYKRRSGVILDQQGMDVLGSALNIFGGGKGIATEIWGSTTINLNAGYTFQIFGGSEEGVIGQSMEDRDETVTEDGEGTTKNYDYEFNGKHYKYSPAYSCYVNLKGDYAGVTKTNPENNPLMADCEFMYGGGFFGPICGNTVINLGKGRIFNSFAGSCMADILGHAETYIGRMIKDEYQGMMGKLGNTNDENDVPLLDNDKYYEEGFPWVRDITYGGNDLGGLIMGKKDFSGRVRSEAKSLVYNPDNKATADVLMASAYTEYLQGRADAIFGGCYGTYNYKDVEFQNFFNDGTPKEGYSKPYMDNAFVNFRPTYPKENNKVNRVYGAGQGADQETDSSREGDKFQNSSYLLIDIPANMDYYKSTAVFGGGSFNGVGMKYNTQKNTQDDDTPLPTGFTLDQASTIIDLVRGEIGNVYGGSHNEGIVRRSVVNVPTGSTVNVNNIFGGGFGSDVNIPCDVFEAHVNYHSEDATVRNNLYGGNNNADRTLYGQINITTPVWRNKEEKSLAIVYGAGCGVDTWSQYTEVNLLEGAWVREVYGGGENGRVINKETLIKWQNDDPDLVLDMHDYEDKGLEDPLVKTTALGGKYNTNVHIHKGAVVEEYAYGGGYGDKNISQSGDIYGTTYIDLLGGIVKKDIYAAGTSGSVQDGYETKKTKISFTASATAYIAGGSCRNVYGGGWKGSVGSHMKTMNVDGKEVKVEAGLYEPADNDISGETHVVIGIRQDQTTPPDDYGFYNGVPVIQRNAYGGGEGGAVYGTSHLTLNNGYIGYEYVDGTYQEKLDDETYFENEQYAGENRLRDCGNVFGGGYDARSCVDESNVTIWGGTIRSSLYGGGEIATIGRGSTQESGEANHIREFQKIYKAGKTHVEMYNGHVLRNVFAGGKGYNLLGYGSNSGLYTDGYVFGQTEVLIHGGEIGTEKGVEEKGYGNVFGGGDLGYVYSKGYENEYSRQTGTGSPDHYYYYQSVYRCKTAYDNHEVNDEIDQATYDYLSEEQKKKWEAKSKELTEDCKVVIAPYLQVKEGKNVTYNAKTYNAYDYVPTDYLNTLPKDKNDDGWANLITNETINGKSVDRGVTIHNAVFAGGNVASNSDTHYANATTVYGNVTATLYDVYHRDFITVGAEHVGGLYGGGNLSMVDGYRELNITNYGTDYYSLKQKITIEEYKKLSNRERAYFQLEYECKDNYEGTTSHTQGQRISEDDFNKLPDGEKVHWEQYGFCSIYAGRLLNTIQRADLCGVYGSRMVLQGAKDRVADVGEDVEYTINRVGELSLNKQNSVIIADASTDEAFHGNYFGIYSIVHHLGNLTSDVRFVSDYLDKNGDRVEKTDKTGYESYYTYKEPQPKGIWRNQGTCHNHVALASGVYLELTTENSTGNTVDTKDWGYITGVVELDLINVKLLHEGGGYVYAKNEHRIPKFYADKENVILSEYNKDKANNSDPTGVHAAAKTYKRYRYSDKYDDGEHKGESNEAEWSSAGTEFVAPGETAYDPKEIQTSGNFIHASKRIIDDCFPVIDRYKMDDSQRSPAHYWYLKGSVYVYDQIVSAYTGAAAAYSKEVQLPLSITAASNGQLKLLNVKPNRYAYFDESNPKVKDGKIWVNHQADAYELNDVITWWDWQNLPSDEQALFVEETYVNCIACKIDGKDYAVGEYVMLPENISTFKNVTHTFTDLEGKALTDDDGNEYDAAHYGTEAKAFAALVDDVFRTSNNMGHNTGYVLTFDMDTPNIWDDYYTKKNDKTVKISKSDYETLLKNAADEAARQTIENTYVEGPTFYPTTDGTYGSRDYSIGQILTKGEYDNFASASDKEKVNPAYVAKEVVTYNDGTKTKTINPGTAISETEYLYLGTSGQSGKQGSFDEAFVCTNTVKLADEVYILRGELLAEAEITTLKDTYAKDGGVYTALADEIDAATTRAYICIEGGNYGGSTYSTNTNYNALMTWCTLSKEDRTYFNYNYDALDLFADPNYSVDPDYTSDSHGIDMKTTTGAYDYLPANTANGNKIYSKVVDVEYNAVFKATSEKTSYTYSQGTLYDGQSMSSTYFENEVRNDQCHYTKVTVVKNDDKVYLANQNFIYKGVPYGRGQEVDADVYTANSTAVDEVSGLSVGTHYLCYESHVDANGNTIPKCVNKGVLVPSGVITETAYKQLTNDQQYFDIQGKIPEETTTLYVNRESDIKDVTQEKVITVVYQYTYYEEDDDGDYKLTNELHVVNVHLQMESGIPTIGPLENPPLVLPGDAVGLKLPEVTPGSYEVLTNGWELFANENDAINHRNGVPFTNNETPVYWYQNGDNYIAYYSKTYLGKTYSNYVPLAVANYHDIADIMERQKENHLYIDRSDVDRPCKIYINDYSTLDADDKRKGKNGLDELRALYDLSVLTPPSLDSNGLIESGSFKGHAPLGSHIKGCGNLEIILRTDIDRTKPAEGDWTEWTPIGDATTCFGGNIHGDGHTISGLETSLFGHLCGNVYNLGVTGSFNSAGVVDTGDGFVENCWVKTTATTAAGTKPFAVFGDPSDDKGLQLVNCYYPESNKDLYSTEECDRGTARVMPDKAFYNGEVTYDLNGFYLGKRYYDNNTTWASALNDDEKMPYNYLASAADGTLPATASTGYYPSVFAIYPLPGTVKEGVETGIHGYVENRFYDGDFRYADGTIPESFNIRRQESKVTVNTQTNETVTDITWVPIWPDDYLFFGQKLTYGHVEDQTHQKQPSTINKANERLLTSEQGNRVYRAPAYFRNNTMSTAHFNPYAVFAKTNSDETMDVHKDMTAIDFTGYNDSQYKQGWNDNLFYQPLLDDDGLTDFVNVGLTKNLLAYTFEPVGTGEGETPTAAQKKTANVVSDVLHDYEYEETNPTYHTVKPWDQGNMSDMYGHWVKKTNSGYVAEYDHYLVDKEDFNAPISYTFANGKRMWYQRIPDNYVTASWDSDGNRTTKGWDGVSLPFKVDIVTTQTKGELTHFYSGNITGHEYWLREFKGGSTSTAGDVFKANMRYPEANSTDGDKECTNTFLWDYYYSHNNKNNDSEDRGDDANADNYQKYYYDSRTYNNYPHQAAGTPYLVGFPGVTYYEFDLSGKFVPQHTATPAPAVIKDAQVITFASAKGTTIGVSDLELIDVPKGGYSYKPSYLNWTFDADNEDTYALDNDGDSYDHTNGKSVSVSAFRPYFIKGDGGSGSRQFTRSIVFSDESSKLGSDDRDRGNEHGGMLDIYAKRKKIVVASTLPHAVDVRIVTTGGITLSAFTVEPGETVETRVNSSGVYIVHTSDARYTTKLSVR